MRKVYILGLVALAAAIIGLAFADQMTFTTYYPAPYGVYRQFITTSKTCLATNLLGTDTDEDPEAMVGIGTTNPDYKLEVNGLMHLGPKKPITIHRDLEIVGGYGPPASIHTTAIGLVNAGTNEKMSILWDCQDKPKKPKCLTFFYDTDTPSAGTAPFVFDLDNWIGYAVNGWEKGTSPGDFADMFTSRQTLESGDVVSIDETRSLCVRKANSPYDKKVIGIISENPGFLAGADLRKDLEEGVYAFPVALSGQVYTKVSLENGPIEVGDYLTSSSIAGHAMKATSAGPVVGKALELFHGGPEGEKTGKILVFVDMGYYGGGSEEEITQLEAKVEKLEALLKQRELVSR